MTKRRYPINRLFSALLLAAVLAACQTGFAPRATDPAAGATAANKVLSEPTSTACLTEQVLPVLSEIHPGQAAYGETVQVIGSGGYSRDSCGGINESARSFPLYLDRDAVGTLGCYVNHCEGAMRIPANTPPGPHCISMEPGKCNAQVEVQR